MNIELYVKFFATLFTLLITVLCWTVYIQLNIEDVDLNSVYRISSASSAFSACTILLVSIWWYFYTRKIILGAAFITSVLVFTLILGVVLVNSETSRRTLATRREKIELSKNLSLGAAISATILFIILMMIWLVKTN